MLCNLKQKAREKLCNKLMLVLHRKAHFAVSKLLTDHDHTHKAIKLVKSAKVMCSLMTDLQRAVALMNDVKSKQYNINKQHLQLITRIT